MQKILSKISKEFIEIKPDTNVFKAYELLSNPKINTLIFRENDDILFFFVTKYMLNKCFHDNAENTEIKVKDIAQKSIIFNYDLYKKDPSRYMKEFKISLHKFNLRSSNLILVIINYKPVGLLSDLDFKETEEEKPLRSDSVLDKFLNTEVDPLKNIDAFYQQVGFMGFELNDSLKDYIKEKLISRMTDRVKNELLPQLDQLIAQSIVKEDSVSDRNLDEPIIEYNEDLPDNIEITQDYIEKEKNLNNPIGLEIIYNPRHITHRPTVSSPETPQRLTKIIALLKDREKIFNGFCKLISEFDAASEEDILRVHTRHYMDFVKNYSAKGGGFLGDSTYFTKYTHELALLAAGGAIRSAEEVLSGRTEFAFGLIRPPGHHATKDKYGGYCIYNNAAVLARYLQVKRGIEKILILDWDAHAANGTMEIFYDDPTVMLISLHQDPHNYYPKTGFGSQMGKLQGLGYTVNVEMPRGSSNQEYLTVFNELVIPLYQKFQPDFVIGCNGFDAHHSDPYTDLELTADGYYEFCKIFKKYMRNKMVILMEGGYNPFMGELSHTMVNGLLDLPKPMEDKFELLAHKVVSAEKTHMILNKKLKELQYNLKRYRVL